MARTGGMRPATRKRSPRHLSADEREELSRGLLAALGGRRRRVRGTSPPTDSREASAGQRTQPPGAVGTPSPTSCLRTLGFARRWSASSRCTGRRSRSRRGLVCTPHQGLRVPEQGISPAPRVPDARSASLVALRASASSTLRLRSSIRAGLEVGGRRTSSAAWAQDGRREPASWAPRRAPRGGPR